MFGKYSVNNLICEFVQNKDKIHAFATGKCIESYNGNNEDANKILGLSIGLFLIIFAIALAIWIWALVALIQNWNRLSDLVKIIALVTLLGVGGPVVTLIIVYSMRNGNGKPSSVEVPMKNLKYKMNASSPSPNWTAARQDGESDIYWFDEKNPQNVTWTNPNPGTIPPENTIAVAYPPKDREYSQIDKNVARYVMLKKYPEMKLGPAGGGGGGILLGPWDISYPPQPPPRLSPDVFPATQDGGSGDGGPPQQPRPTWGEVETSAPPWAPPIPYEPDEKCSLSGGKGCTIS